MSLVVEQAGLLVPLVLAYAIPVGVGLLIAAVLVRLVGRALGFALFAAGALVAAYVGFQQWQATGDLLLVVTVLAAGIAASGFLAWVVRAVSFVVAIGLVAVAWYLLLYGSMGEAFLTTTTGYVTWGVAALLSAIAVLRLGGRPRLRPAPGLAVVAAASQN